MKTVRFFLRVCDFEEISNTFSFKTDFEKYFKKDHTLDQHLISLNGLCRYCGNVNLTQKQKSASHYPSLCKDPSNDIFVISDIDIASDQDDKHSKFICHNCLCTIKNAKKTQSQASITTARNKKKL